MIEPAPYRDDFAALALASRGLRDPVILASAPARGRELARYSVAAAEPILSLHADAPRDPIKLLRGADGRVVDLHESFSSALAAALDPLAPLAQTELLRLGEQDAPFLGGLIGFLAFEFGARFERMPIRPPEPGALPAMRLGCYPAAYLADHARREAWWICRERKGERRGELLSILERIKEWIIGAPAEVGAGPTSDPPRDAWMMSLDGAAQRAAVERIKSLLRQGEAYQVNLTSRMRREYGGDPARVFAELTRRNPAPYAAFIRAERWAIASSSPELLIDLRPDGAIQTRPIKGTIRAAAGGSDAKDREQIAALKRSPKDRAEHLMIVDLERNDLGRVCEYGSIRVEPMMGVESYRGLHHLVSTVRGRMRRGLGPADAIAALFPGGSVVGAPKVRALEIIHELEPAPRGAYCGAIGWITPEGGCRMNLAIRTISIAVGRLDVHAGGGIVVDSEAEAESAELELKAKPLLDAAEAAAAPRTSIHPL